MFLSWSACKLSCKGVRVEELIAGAHGIEGSETEPCRLGLWLSEFFDQRGVSTSGAIPSWTNGWCRNI